MLRHVLSLRGNDVLKEPAPSNISVEETKMGASGSSKMMTPPDQTVWRHIPYDNNLQISILFTVTTCNINQCHQSNHSSLSLKLGFTYTNSHITITLQYIHCTRDLTVSSGKNVVIAKTLPCNMNLIINTALHYVQWYLYLLPG